MNYSNLFSLLLLSVFPLWATAQKEAQEVRAIEVSESLMELLQETAVANYYLEDNILRPAKGHDMYFLPETQRFIVKPVEQAIISEDGFDIKEVPGGVMFCLCGKASDDCEIKINIDDNTIMYFCDGSCGCGSFTIFDVSKDFLSMQTVDGGWQPFRR